MEPNEQYIEELKTIVKFHCFNVAQILNAKKNKHLLDYVNDWCKFMDADQHKYKIITKVWYTLNKIPNFVRCKNARCNREIHKDIVRLADPGLQYCNCKCLYTDDNHKEHLSKTIKSFSAEKKELKAKRRKATCKKLYGDENWRNAPKARQTLQAKYGKGIVSIFQVPEIRQQVREANIKKYGVPSYTQTKECQEKIANTCYERYGESRYAKTNECKERVKTTCLQKYGSMNPIGNEKVQDKSKQTCRLKYGCNFSSQSPDIQRKQKRKYYVELTKFFPESDEVLKFDSLAELAFYIHMRRSNQKVEQQPNVFFEYQFDGNIYRYFPDFKVGTKFYEIKGNQFFKNKDPNERMICPYRYKNWSDAEYLHMCDKYEAKHQCMLANNVIILTSKDYDRFIDEMKEQYGPEIITHIQRSK